MLDPNVRKLYLSSLRPPEGFSFDRAIGTTFTLDLFNLLAIPLSFAKFEIKSKEDLLKDPISILEALRRLTGKFLIFCQSGQIKIPPSVNPLFIYLEKMIIEVSSPNPDGIFHPKIWVLRYKNKSGKILYRFLCLSRNITFDKSWDTILTLEGDVRKRVFARNRPLSDFLLALPSLSKKRLLRQSIRDIEEIADEIRHMDFKQPVGFYDDFHFRPMGIPGYKNFHFQDNYWRILVVSPFLTNDLLDRLASKYNNNILISQLESLNSLKSDVLEKYEKKYFMDEAASEVDEIDKESTAGKPSKYEELDADLSGLHAKLFLAESGWDAHLWTGSANATNAAFDGLNVEFLVELHGKKSQMGIKRLLEERKGVTNFYDLLIEYIPTEAPVPEEEKIKKDLERQLEKIRRQLSNANLRAVVLSKKRKNLYDLKILFSGKTKFPEDIEIEGKCWPISLKMGLAQKLSIPKLEPHLLFHDLTVDKITSLTGFEFIARHKSIKQSVRFVLNLPIQGIPHRRYEKIVQTIVSNRENFLRYLLLLLREGEFTDFYQELGKRSGESFKGEKTFFSFKDIPLFEELVRAYSRDPEKIMRISKLVEDVKKMEGGEKILPDGFIELWEAFQKAKRLGG